MNKGVKKGIFWRYTLTIFMFIFAVMLIMSYISMFFNPARLWLMPIFGLAFLPMFFINIIFLIWGICKKSLNFLIPLIALLPCLFVIGRYYQFGFSPKVEGDIKVLSYNVGNFELDKYNLSKSDCRDSVIKFIRESKADIINLQEFSIDRSINLDTYLRNNFRGYNFTYYMNKGTNRQFGNIILTHYPIINKGYFNFEKSTNLAIYCDCLISDKTVRLYNCHFQSYSISLKGLVSSFRRDYKSSVTNTETKLRKAISMRPKQVNQVMLDIYKSPYNSLICGDFNDGPISYTYYRLMKFQGDSFEKAGSGFAATYSLLWPLLRVDYILFPKIFNAQTHIVPKVHYSDHYPVIASFNIK